MVRVEGFAALTAAALASSSAASVVSAFGQGQSKGKSKAKDNLALALGLASGVRSVPLLHRHHRHFRNLQSQDPSRRLPPLFVSRSSEASCQQQPCQQPPWLG